MGRTNKDEYNEYLRYYMRRRYAQRRQIALERLGGQCAACRSVDELEVDHIDPSTKTMSFERMTMVSMERFLAELTLCQLLCRDCHIEKTKAERVTSEHGTTNRYWKWKCRCDLCRGAASRWKRESRRKKKKNIAPVV